VFNFGLGIGIRFGSGLGIRFGSGLRTGLGIGLGTGLGIGLGTGLGIGLGIGSELVTGTAIVTSATGTSNACSGITFEFANIRTCSSLILGPSLLRGYISRL